MKSLTELGFKKRPLVEQILSGDLTQRAEVRLPASYLAFLSFTPPAGVVFGYRFRRSPEGDEWEGQVERFFDYTVASGVVDRSMIQWDGHLLLPIASDAGGNEIMLDLNSTGQPVVDQDYGTGRLSLIAPNFDAFVEGLYTID